MSESAIKLIWDFKGSTAQKIAEHHAKHLKEYCIIHQTEYSITGIEIIHEMHCIAYMVISKKEIIPIRDALKPQRAVIYEAE